MPPKSAVRTEEAPAPFQGAPYSQAIRCGDFVFVSGQLPLSPAGEVVGATIQEQTEQVLRNLAAILIVAAAVVGTRLYIQRQWFVGESNGEAGVGPWCGVMRRTPFGREGGPPVRPGVMTL